MTSSRPYLIRALIDWMVDNACTPYVAIACDDAGAEDLLDYATDGRLVLNLSAGATRGLVVDDEHLSVDCRFGGKPVHVSVPIGMVIAVYARENGMGMAFELASDEAPTEPEPPGRPRLSLVK